MSAKLVTTVLDFTERALEKQPAPIYWCDGCGQEIYPGEDVWVLDGGIIHRDDVCLIRAVAPEEMTIEEALNDE